LATKHIGGVDMDRISETLNVYFEDPFWVGVFERVYEEKLSVCKVIFGAEPKDYDVAQFILKNYMRMKFSPTVETVVKECNMNPKRMLREVHKLANSSGIGTKSQQALKIQQEQMKTERKVRSREQKEAKTQRKFDLKQQKRKEKHRGR
jgi:hypothetical protein